MCCELLNSVKNVLRTPDVQTRSRTVQPTRCANKFRFWRQNGMPVAFALIDVSQCVLQVAQSPRVATVIAKFGPLPVPCAQIACATRRQHLAPN